LKEKDKIMANYYDKSSDTYYQMAVIKKQLDDIKTAKRKAVSDGTSVGVNLYKAWSKQQDVDTAIALAEKTSEGKNIYQYSDAYKNSPWYKKAFTSSKNRIEVKPTMEGASKNRIEAKPTMEGVDWRRNKAYEAAKRGGEYSNVDFSNLPDAPAPTPKVTKAIPANVTSAQAPSKAKSAVLDKFIEAEKKAIFTDAGQGMAENLQGAGAMFDDVNWENRLIMSKAGDSPYSNVDFSNLPDRPLPTPKVTEAIPADVSFSAKSGEIAANKSGEIAVEATKDAAKDAAKDAGAGTLGKLGKGLGVASSLYSAYNLSKNWENMSRTDKALGTASTLLGIGSLFMGPLGWAAAGVQALDYFVD
jgi:hypothetical protein